MRWNMSPKRCSELQDTTCHSEWWKLSHQIPPKTGSIILTSLYYFEDQVILFMYMPVHAHVYSWAYVCVQVYMHVCAPAYGSQRMTSGVIPQDTVYLCLLFWSLALALIWNLLIM